MQLEQHFADQMGQIVGPDFPSEIGLAVSGGGDSMALLSLAAGWARRFGVRLRPVTIDHGLRPDSANEAAMVAEECAGFGLGHDTLHWTDWDGVGNLQAAARDARHRLIDQWRGSTRHVLFAHTLDDQAETFLMRLVRGSGVDGLSGMRQSQTVASPSGDPWVILRPLLDVARADLRHYLRTLRIPYVDDPTNADDTFQRVRVRQFLEAEGLDQRRLIATQQAMQRAQEALRYRAHQAAIACMEPIAADETVEGILTFDRDIFGSLEAETQMRLFAAALQFVTGTPYRPRLTSLSAVLEKVLAGGTTTLHGATIVPKANRIFVGREFDAVAKLRVPSCDQPVWDNSLMLQGVDFMDHIIAPLGAAGATDALAQSAKRIPWELARGLPALWKDNAMCACAALNIGPDHGQTWLRPGKEFPMSLLAH